MKTILIVFFSALFLPFICMAQRAKSDSAFHFIKPDHMTREQRMVSLKRGMHGYVEWIGMYGGPGNYIDDHLFGATAKGNLRMKNGAHLGLGYQFDPHLYIGGGIGADYQDRAYADISMGPTYTNYVGGLFDFPVYGEIKGFLLHKPVTPFVQFRVGYAPVLSVAEKRANIESSAYVNLAIGVSIHSHICLTAGYLLIYEPEVFTGFDRFGNGAPLFDGTHPYQHYFTLGFTIFVSKYPEEKSK